MRTVLVTNVKQYAGPGALAALLEQGNRVICHDASFAAQEARFVFEREWPGAMALAAASPDDLFEEVRSRHGLPDAVVLNAVHPITPCTIEEVPREEFLSTFEAVLWTPVRLAQLFLPGMKARRSGSFVFVTSARERRPEPGYAVPTTLRASATAFAKALAVEAAPFGIQSNVVAPNYLESEMYYPAARFVHDPAGRALIQSLIPAGRLGRQDEVGALIAFLASGTSPFTTGQVIHFAGGWAV